MSAARPAGHALAGDPPGCGDWDSLPLPAMLLDGELRITALNDAAEAWLNLSRRAASGLSFEDEALAGRVALTPPLSEMAALVARGHDALVHPGLRVTFGRRGPAPVVRQATLHLAPAEAGYSLVLIPDDAARHAPARAARGAALAAIGMADMLAHEIKNPLAGIRGAAQLLAMELPEGQPELSDLTALIVDESRRIVALLEQVERFGDTSPPALAPVNLHDVLERARLSAELSFARAVRILPAYDPSLPPVVADADQLVQLVLNLLRNAAEALAGRPDPLIRIRSFYDGGLRQAPEAGGRPLPIQLEIEDNGPGLPEPIAERVFEPFVSGRENGTGLGLALVAKITADLGAWISVDSHPGRTVFRLSLPKA
ncbi:PAS domain-containing sensor histidine kinase [Paracoccus suum]|uniref:histidine kinase n=1 Tax=Paracoccus suum TaxID=2259340 RepID=A0A344PN98_9RHOB|nr:ATP-binding protein [Paracoccus suum]AXC50853.1 PAS domain-containing sensor histidine kinase [Paracoccus suum]